jgi:uncharacterized membrane protein
MAKRRVKNKDDSKLEAFLATFLSIIGFVIALIAWKDDKYVMHYAKISLVVFVIGAIAGIIAKIFFILPIIGGIINFALGVIVILIWILSWAYALSGEKKEISIVSHWANKVDL